jgi:hypothetical protein
MSMISESLRNTSTKSLLLQILAIVIGIIGSMALVILGFLQEGLFDIITSPFVGLVNQLQIMSLTQLGPTLILIFGCLGFLGLILIPGIILSRFVYPQLNGFTRLLLSTSISLILVFFPISYGLLLGFAPHWILIAMPLFLAIIVCLIRPNLLKDTYEEFVIAVNWIWQDMKERRNIWFWIPFVFFTLVRFTMFSYTDSYWTDSVTYVGYAEAIANGTLLTGHDFSNPIGFPLFAYPFVWLAGSIPWGLALANWVLTVIALFGFYPILKRIYNAWPSERKPPFKLFLLVFISFPWQTILMSSIFHEATLLFVTVLGAEAIGGRLRWSEIWLGLAIGIGYLIRPTHAVMFFVFMLIPLYENRQSIANFFATGLRSFVVALPVIPLLIRNLLVEGWIFANYDLQYFGLSNIPDVLMWMASFVTHSDVGLFTLLFVIPLLLASITMTMRIRKFNSETLVWILLSIVSFFIFAIYPTDQPRLYSFFFWLIPIIFLMEVWDKGWGLTCFVFTGWQLLIFGAIPFSPQGWIIDGASSYLSGVAGIQRTILLADVTVSFIGSVSSVLFWLILTYLFNRRKVEFENEEIEGGSMSSIE